MAKLISKTYGEALFEVAMEEGTLDSMLEEVEAVFEILKSNEEYIELLNHPRIPVEEKVSMVESAFKGKVSDELVGFLVTIVEKGRFSEVENILTYFIDRVSIISNVNGEPFEYGDVMEGHISMKIIGVKVI